VIDDGPPYEDMTLDEAKMIWLTMLGSGWVDEDVLMNEPHGSVLDVAGMILEHEALLEYNRYHYKIKLRCKS
jgi:hypothetical protein